MNNSLNCYSVQYLPEGVIKKIEAGALEVTGTEADAPTFSFGENKTVGSEVPTIWIEKSFYTVKGTNLVNSIFGKKEFNYPKPLELVTEILRGASENNDIVLDSFSGSGTTAHAVLNLNKQDGGNRKFILVEMEDYAETITAERVKRVINGYADVEGTGGSFDYCELGPRLFDDNGNLNEQVPVSTIREYIWYSETRSAFVALTEDQLRNPYFLGIKEDTGYYFFYEPQQVTTLDYDFLGTISLKAEQYVVYADNCLLSKTFLQNNNIIFKKIPRDISRL
jgi:adenine-specific DNA-methyltransferase